MSHEAVWPEHFSGFKQIDTLLKCGICYEFMKTALITPCSHNYCSYCIRKSLLYKSQCPTCFEETNEPQLRNNRVLDQLVSIYTNIRESLIRHLISSKDDHVHNGLHVTAKTEMVQNIAVKGNFPGVSTSNNSVINRAEPIKQSKSIDFGHQRSLGRCASTTEPPIVIYSDSDSDENVKPLPSRGEQHIPSIFSPKRPNNGPTVPCPVCTVDIPQQNINKHLDTCLQRAEQTEHRVSRKENRKPLPKLVYSLLQEKDLKKKLKAHGLSILGDRRTLINRHQRFTLLYNSECDSIKPRSVSVIIQQLEKEELEEKKATNAPLQITKLNVDRKADPRVIEEAQQQYLRDHKSSFQGLIQSIRNQEVKKKTLPVETEPAVEEYVDDPEVVFIENLKPESETFQPTTKKPCRPNRIVSDSEDDTDECVDEMTSCFQVHNATSPVLGRRNQPIPSASSARVDAAGIREGSMTPDMFGERSPPESSTTGQDTNKIAEDSDEDSNASMSLMMYHTEAFEAGDQNQEKQNEAMPDDECQQSSDMAIEHSNIQERNGDILQIEDNSKFKTKNFNFELGIDALLSDSEKEFLPVRKSKRKTVIASPSAEEPTTQRTLRKRIKR